MTQEVKAKRRLKDIDFSKEDSHIALVHKDQGGPASGANYKLVLKALNKESKPAGDDTSKSTEVQEKEGLNPVVKQNNKETNMDELVELKKAMSDQAEMLTKALDRVKEMEAEKQATVVKAKTAKVTEVVKDATKAQPFVKAALALNDEKDFDAFVEALQGITKAVDNSDLFKEKGLQADDVEQPTESAVVKAAKARIAKSVKQ